MEPNDRATVNAQNYAMLKAAKILEQGFTDKFPGIISLANRCNVSVSKLKRDFKNVHGVTPLEYFRGVQISYALDIQKGGEKTLKEVAVNLGFKKPAALTEWYNKMAMKRDKLLIDKK